MPQTLNKEWIKYIGENANKIQKELGNTLGNLTLTGYNSELSNKPFNAKLPLLRKSNLSMNQYFRQIETWNEEQIKDRAEYLAKIAIEIWPR